jgi:RHS repeat-associated protein
MTTMPQPNAPGSQYTGIFDAWQRLVKLVDPSTGDVVQVNQYDGRKFRIVRETYAAGVLSETRQFYHTTSWQVIEERVGADPNTAVLDRQYTWGLRYIDDLVLRDRFTSGTLSERLYAMQDANWNMVALYNAALSAVAERYAYSAYGVCLFLDASFNLLSGGSAYDWTVLYTGRELDSAPGLYYYRRRFYLAMLGGFVNRDPVEADRNPYLYCENGPTNGMDPSGLRITDNPTEGTLYLDELIAFRVLRGAETYLSNDDDAVGCANTVEKSIRNIRSEDKVKIHYLWITYEMSPFKSAPLQFAEDAAVKAKQNPNSVFLYIGHGTVTPTDEVNSKDVESVKSAVSGVPATSLLYFSGCYGTFYNKAAGKHCFADLPDNSKEVTASELVKILSKALPPIYKQICEKEKKEGTIDVYIYFGEYFRKVQGRENASLSNYEETLKAQGKTTGDPFEKFNVKHW